VITPLGFFDLIETFPQAGCAICKLLVRDVHQFLDSLMYEFMNERETHATFRAARGLCNEHGWQVVRLKGTSLGIAILYRASVDELLKIVQQTPQPTSGVSRFLGGSSDQVALANRLEPVGSCPACDALLDSEKRYLQIFSQNFSRLEVAYQGSTGFCLPHFRLALREVRDPTHVRQMITIQTEIWTRLKAELEEFADKNDHQRIHETMGAEGDSWQRAIGQMAGEKGIFGIRGKA
jgi:hypothetical protein